jgi:hypothetical protein
MEQEEKKWAKVGDLKVMQGCDLSVGQKIPAILSCSINHSSVLLPFGLYTYPSCLSKYKSVYVGVFAWQCECSFAFFHHVVENGYF